MARVAITKKVRFEVFKRDQFTCQYCGNKPPSVVLEIDHINPIANGGTEDMNNIITACFDCNRGKSDGLLSNIPKTVEQRAEILKEKEDQLKAYDRLIKSIRRNTEKRINKIEELFSVHFENYIFSISFRKSVSTFVSNLPLDIVMEAMDIACSRIDNPNAAIKYFCGICWNKIKDHNNG